MNYRHGPTKIKSTLFTNRALQPIGLLMLKVKQVLQ